MPASLSRGTPTLSAYKTMKQLNLSTFPFFFSRLNKNCSELTGNNVTPRCGSPPPCSCPDRRHLSPAQPLAHLPSHEEQLNYKARSAGQRLPERQWRESKLRALQRSCQAAERQAGGDGCRRSHSDGNSGPSGSEMPGCTPCSWSP